MNASILVAVLLLTVISFVLAMLWTPLLTHYLYKYKCWRKSGKKLTVDGRPATIVSQLEKETNFQNTPRMGGLLVWVTTIVLAAVFWLLDRGMGLPFFDELNFVSRGQTWIPLFTLLAASLVGLADDWYVIQESEKHEKGSGIRFRHRLMMVSLIGLAGGSWLYLKLGWNTVHIPFVGDAVIGILFIPLFVLVVDTFFTGTIIDGIDGLSGGVLSTVFASFTALALARGQYDLAGLCAVILGALLAFLWFNIPPARFYLSETGIIGLTTTLAVVAFFLDAIVLLPFFASIILLEVVSNILQLGSKRLRNGKKIFLAAPIHHHFQAKGWPSHKVTMRFWLISAVFSMMGLVIALIDLHLI